MLPEQVRKKRKTETPSIGITVANLTDSEVLSLCELISRKCLKRKGSTSCLHNSFTDISGLNITAMMEFVRRCQRESSLQNKVESRQFLFFKFRESLLEEPSSTQDCQHQWLMNGKQVFNYRFYD
jgi:hypothetical protein